MPEYTVARFPFTDEVSFTYLNLSDRDLVALRRASMKTLFFNKIE